MIINVTGRKMSVGEDLKALISKKLAKLDKYFRDDATAYVTLRPEKNGERIEVTVSSAGTLFRSEETDTTFNNALDTAVDTIERQIRKNKTRLEKRLRDGAFARTEPEPEQFDEDRFEIREKSFPIKPMTADEAILQMNLLGHGFYMFFNVDTNTDAVVYKRKNGGYGMIVPEK